MIGHQVATFSSLESTNSHLKKMISATAIAEGFAVRAKYQTLGRGQIGNTWVSEMGKNLLLSVFLKPQRLPVQQYFFLNMSVCLALVDCLNHFAQGFILKWPNDILFEKKKVAGILIENSIAGAAIQHSIVGIGLNVNQRVFSDSFNPKATSLATVLGKSIVIEEVQKKLFEHLQIRYQQLQLDAGSLKSDYYNNLHGYRTEVPVYLDGQPQTLQIEGVADNGQLQTTIGGLQRTFDFKELRFLF